MLDILFMCEGEAKCDELFSSLSYAVDKDIATVNSVAAAWKQAKSEGWVKVRELGCDRHFETYHFCPAHKALLDDGQK